MSSYDELSAAISQINVATAALQREVDKLKPTPPPKVPCPEGFYWIGQPIYSCDMCGLPAWEHEGEARAKLESPFDDSPFILHPWPEGWKEQMKAKWERKEP